MAIISLIAAVDENYGLGKNNQLLCHLPADLQHFKRLTWGKPIIMGRNTFEAIGKPLPGRVNIVLSRSSLAIEGVHVVNSLSKALDLSVDAAEIMIIGGESIYKQAFPVAKRIYLTLIHHQFAADVFFPKPSKLGRNKGEEFSWGANNTFWRCEEAIFHPQDDKNPYELTFYRYQRRE